MSDQVAENSKKQKQALKLSIDVQAEKNPF